jgi:Capsule polysaccharide biosynthesis protein
VDGRHTPLISRFTHVPSYKEQFTLMQPAEYDAILLEAQKKLSAIAASIPPAVGGAKRPILLDGIFSSASNTLRNLAIYFAARKTGICDQALYLTSTKETNHALYSSLGINQWGIEIPKASLAERLTNAVLSYMPWTIVRNSMRKRQYRGVFLEPYAIDTAVRYTAKAYSLKDVPKRIALNNCTNAKQIAIGMENSIRRFQPVAMAISHKFYNIFGMPGVTSIVNGIPVFSLSNAYIRKCTTVEEWNSGDFTLTEDLMEEIRKVVSPEVAHAYANARFRGHGQYIDSVDGYAGKRTTTRQMIVQELGLDDEKPIAMIMPHAFSDANHADKWMIYDTYFEWYKRVLELTASIPNVNWVVRTHPSSHMYNEVGVGESFAKQYPHVRVLRSDIQTSSVFGFADAVLTVRGTAGLEALYFGVQPILSGAVWYDSLPGIVSCRSEAKLVQALRHISKRKPIETDNAETATRRTDVARAIYFCYATYDYTQPSVGMERNPGLISADVLAHDGQVLSEFVQAFSDTDSYWRDPYIVALLKMFENQDSRLSILELAAPPLVKS